MMNANELRIGNLVQENFPPLLEVLSIDSTYVRVRKDGILTTMIDVHDLTPIALTPQILEKLGFKQPASTVWEHDTAYIELVYSEEDKGFLLLINNEYTEGKPIKYLHELQNLSFALYGEELEIQQQNHPD